jgi:large subunit ribosomal protein L24
MQGSMFGQKLRSASLAPSTRVSPVALTVTAAWGRRAKLGPGRKWEYLEKNDNGNVERIPMHVKKGDDVMVIAGDDKNKTGKIIKIDRKRSLIMVEGVNIVTKHVKKVSETEPGRIEKKEAFIHSSNVMHYSKTKNVRSRIGYKVLEDGKKVRFLVKTGEVIDQ